MHVFLHVYLLFMRVFSQKDKLSVSYVLFLLLMNLTFNFYLKAYDRFFVNSNGIFLQNIQLLNKFWNILIKWTAIKIQILSLIIKVYLLAFYMVFQLNMLLNCHYGCTGESLEFMLAQLSWYSWVSLPNKLTTLTVKNKFRKRYLFYWNWKPTKLHPHK